jgi:hypothetical protein
MATMAGRGVIHGQNRIEIDTAGVESDWAGPHPLENYCRNDTDVIIAIIK